MDKAEADATLTRLQRAARAHARNQDSLRHTITQQEDRIADLTRHIAGIDTAIARRQNTSGDKFTMTVADRRHTRRADAGQHLTAELRQAFSRFDGLREQTLQPGALAGFPLTARLHRVLGTPTVTLSLDGAPGTAIEIPAHELSGADSAGIVTRLENRVRRLEERRAATVADVDLANREVEHATASLGKPFPQAAELAAARERARQIDAELNRQVERTQSAEETPEADGSQPGQAGAHERDSDRHTSTGGDAPHLGRPHGRRGDRSADAEAEAGS